MDATGESLSEQLRRRLGRARESARAAGVDALVISPGADLRYLTGYDALPLERLTCLVLPSDGDAVLVAPELEVPAASASPASELGMDIVGWAETADPYRLVASWLGLGAAGRRIAVDNRMWAEKVMGLREALPDVELTLAGPLLRELRMRKTGAEVAALRRAGAAIDRVHAQVGALVRAGRSEREIGREIAELIISEGHVRADFVIVASGPNAASPHHDVTDRVLCPGDAVVVDIGGTTEEGYCSDCTRTYHLGDPEAQFADYYEVLRSAQDAACAAVRPGVSAEAVDAAAREPITEAGYGPCFIHRTGHGIGLEGHEEPYIIAGNPLPLEPGMAFSVEPGIYLRGRHGARIEDIVVCTETGVERLNTGSRELAVLEV